MNGDMNSPQNERKMIFSGSLDAFTKYAVDRIRLIPHFGIDNPRNYFEPMVIRFKFFISAKMK